MSELTPGADGAAATNSAVVDVEDAVRARYSGGAQECEAALCCPTSYDPKLLEAIPDAVLERDYGCGDPSHYLRAGETVLDLGSGSGKHCFMSAQVVGPTGRVIGVDMNDDMLALARSAAPEVARRIGYANVEFRRGKIQDLRVDRDQVGAYLAENPVTNDADLQRLESKMATLAETSPLIPDESIDVVVSNCVLNLVRPADKRQLFRELHRVLRRGGRAVISDIVCDEPIPAAMQADGELWSGCISGAFVEDEFLYAFEDAGFYGVEILERSEAPWQTVKGLEFRSITVAAYRGKEGACLDQGHAVIYKGPFREVVDDDGHTYRRGVRTAVCEKTFHICAREPYRAHVELVVPHTVIPLDDAPVFACDVVPAVRDPRRTKGDGYHESIAADACCGPTGAGGGTNGASSGGCC